MNRNLAKLLGISVISIFGLVSSSHAQAGTILFSQAAAGDGNYWSSQNDTSDGFGNFATLFDNFTLSSDSTLDEISWTGVYFNPPEPGTIASFTLQLYSDSSNAPGSSIYSTSAASFNETSVGDLGGVPGFSYDVTGLATPVLTAGTQYWLSIVPDLGFPPQWGWASGSGGDGAAYQVFFGEPSYLAGDVAFTLSGSTQSEAPEPATLGLLAIGLSGFLLASRLRARFQS